MKNHFENYSSTDWANNFLLEIQNQFSSNQERREFIGMLDKHNVQEDEAYSFLEAFQKPNRKEAIKEFLEHRYLEKEPDTVKPSKEPISPRKAA